MSKWGLLSKFPESVWVLISNFPVLVWFLIPKLPVWVWFLIFKLPLSACVLIFKLAVSVWVLMSKLVACVNVGFHCHPSVSLIGVDFAFLPWCLSCGGYCLSTNSFKLLGGLGCTNQVFFTSQQVSSHVRTGLPMLPSVYFSRHWQ